MVRIEFMLFILSFLIYSKRIQVPLCVRTYTRNWVISKEQRICVQVWNIQINNPFKKKYRKKAFQQTPLGDNSLKTFYLSYCDGLYMLGPENGYDGMSMLGPESGTIKMCGLVGESMSLWGQALRPSSQLCEDSVLLGNFR